MLIAKIPERLNLLFLFSFFCAIIEIFKLEMGFRLMILFFFSLAKFYSLICFLHWAVKCKLLNKCWLQRFHRDLICFFFLAFFVQSLKSLNWKMRFWAIKFVFAQLGWVLPPSFYLVGLWNANAKQMLTAQIPERLNLPFLPTFFI